MSLLGFAVRTAARVVLAAPALVHDIAALPATAYGSSPSYVSMLLKDASRDLQDTIQEVRLHQGHWHV